MPARRDLTAPLALLAAVLAVTAPVALLGRCLYYGDITLQFVPWRQYAQSWLLRGIVPLWIQDVYAGMPFLANCQSAVLYPYHWLALGLSPVRAIGYGYVLHVFLAAAGTYAYARRVGRTPSAGVVAGLAFGLGGFVLSKQQFPSLAYTVAWLPWLLWAAEGVWQRPDGCRTAALAGLAGLCWLAGHAQMAVLELALVFVRTVTRPAEAPAAARWSALAGGLALGAVLAAGQLLPTAELLRLSDRSGYGFEDVARFNVPPWQTPMLALPGLFGSPSGRLPYLGVGAYWEMAAYVGLISLGLALCGARRERFWVWTVGVGLVLAMGRYTPVYRWLWSLLPPLQVARDPARFALYASFGLAMLAAAGWEETPAVARRALGRCLGGFIVLLVAALAAPTGWWRWGLDLLAAAAPSKSFGDQTALASLWQATVVGEILGALALLGVAVWLAGRPEALARRALLGLLAADLIAHGIGLNPTAPATVFDGDPRPPAVRAARLVYVPDRELARVAVECFNLARYPTPNRVDRARRALVGNVLVGTGTAALGGYDPLRPKRTGAALRALDSLPEHARARRLAALGVEGIVEGGMMRPIPAAGPAPVTRPTPQRCVSAGPTTLTQAAIPGWRAVFGEWRLADEPLQLELAPSGRDAVRLYYAPAGYRVGLFLGLLALAAVVALAVTSCSSRLQTRVISETAGRVV